MIVCCAVPCCAMLKHDDYLLVLQLFNFVKTYLICILLQMVQILRNSCIRSILGSTVILRSGVSIWV